MIQLKMVCFFSHLFHYKCVCVVWKCLIFCVWFLSKNRKKESINNQSIDQRTKKSIMFVLFCFVWGFFFNHIHSFFFRVLIGECFAFGFQSVCVVTVLNLSESEWFFFLTLFFVRLINLNLFCVYFDPNLLI